ncbi:MAG: endonuclease III [Sphingomonadales bacterium]|jgi:endonuclease-3
MLASQQVEILFQRFKARDGFSEKRPNVKKEADYFRSLVSCLLSAQSKDENTARAKTALFQLADTPQGILALQDEAIAQAIRPCGLYNMKAKNLRKMCISLLEDHGGIVPKTREGLMSLPGIGRKCADIMLRFSFQEATIAVDTHVYRVCERLGLTSAKTEKEAAEQLDRRAPDWAKFDGHEWLINFGKDVCHARSPKCHMCFLNDLCENAP